LFDKLEYSSIGSRINVLTTEIQLERSYLH
jgi:hypothetical protein